MKQICRIEGLEHVKSYYYIDSEGIVYSNKYGCMTFKAQRMKRGYLYVNLMTYKSTNTKDFTIHRLLAMAYIERVNGKDIVNHKDENKLNNKINNLEWVTNKENVRHSCKSKYLYRNQTSMNINENDIKMTTEDDNNYVIVPKIVLDIDDYKQVSVNRMVTIEQLRIGA